MHRRALLATPLVAPMIAAQQAQAQPAQLATEEFMVPAKDPGIEIFVRNKRPEGMAAFTPGRTLLFVHGATYPAHTAFDLPLGGLSWMDYIAGRGFDVWCMDIRGYGRSTRPAEMSQPPEANPPLVRGDAAVADIGAVNAFIRQKRSLPRIVHMGWSWGTGLTGRFAADNPSVVERVVLYAPQWLREGPSLAAAGQTEELGAYRWVTQAQAKQRWLTGVPPEKVAGLIPPGWFEHWAGVTWATDPEGQRREPAGAAGAEQGDPGQPGLLAIRQALLRPREDHRAGAAGRRRMGPRYPAGAGLHAVSAAGQQPGQAAGDAGGRHAYHHHGAEPRRAVPGGAGLSRGSRGLRPRISRLYRFLIRAVFPAAAAASAPPRQRKTLACSSPSCGAAGGRHASPARRRGCRGARATTRPSG
ncbi:alpha/beta hydrolase [Dankookia sp. P2]|uniref:alpha/beta hydrolase n=1 Tax=Dankookia sp. P2 TaxID=3423955 RepID=UPI003D67DDE9